MSRKPKATCKALAVKEPEVTWKNPDEYIDFTSSLIRYGILMSAKAKNDGKLLESGTDDVYSIDNVDIGLSSRQVQYLNMLMDGISSKDACVGLQLDTAQPLLWEEEAGKNSVYCCCLDALNQIRAKSLEEKVIEKAIKDDKADILKMFVLKRWMPEYRDNAQTQGATIAQFNISIGDKDFKIETDTSKLVNGNG